MLALRYFVVDPKRGFYYFGGVIVLPVGALPNNLPSFLLGGLLMKDVEASVAWWAEHNGCNKNPTAKKISEDVTQNSYGECKGNAEVAFYHINKGGHVWPGSPVAERLVKTGRVKAEEINMDVNASSLICSFFKAHSLP